MGPPTDDDINAAMHIIETLRTMGGRGGARMRGVYPSRIIAAWNNGLDDLGPGGVYPTIIHFVVNIDRLARESMHTDYLSAIRAMPTVRLAGADIGVHPRAIYFAAAAQAEMDVRAGIEQGRGHYIAPGAFFIELRRIQRHIRRLNRQLRTRRRLPSADIMAVVVNIFNILRNRVNAMINVMEAQAGRQVIAGVDPAAHREPGLQTYLLGRADQLRAIPAATSADQVRELAGRLDTALGTIPLAQRAHGWGSIDPHGTDHALGLAIDLFNGRGRAGVSQNFGVPRAYWPFLHRLIELHGTPEVFDSIRPTAIHQMSPAQARELSRLLRDRGRHLAEQMAAEAVPESLQTVRQRRQVVQSFRLLSGRILREYTLYVNADFNFWPANAPRCPPIKRQPACYESANNN